MNERREDPKEGEKKSHRGRPKKTTSQPEGPSIPAAPPVKPPSAEPGEAEEENMDLSSQKRSKKTFRTVTFNPQDEESDELEDYQDFTVKTPPKKKQKTQPLSGTDFSSIFGKMFETAMPIVIVFGLAVLRSVIQQMQNNSFRNTGSEKINMAKDIFPSNQPKPPPNTSPSSFLSHPKTVPPNNGIKEMEFFK